MSIERKVLEIAEENEAFALSRLRRAASESESYHFGQLLRMQERHPSLHRFVGVRGMESGQHMSWGLGAAVAYDLVTMQLESEGRQLEVGEIDIQRYKTAIDKYPEDRLQWLWDRLEVGGQSRYLGLIFSFIGQYEEIYGPARGRKLSEGAISVTGITVASLDPTVAEI